MGTSDPFTELIGWLRGFPEFVLWEGMGPEDFGPAGGRGLGLGEGATGFDGKLLLRIPFEAMPTSRLALHGPLRPVFQAHPALLSPFHALILWLYVEVSRPNSDWTLYFNTLPKSFSTPAMCGELREELFPPSCRGEVRLQVEELAVLRDRLERVWADVLRCVDPKVAGESLEEERLLWAWAVVNTRCVFVETPLDPLLKTEDGVDGIALIPLFDLFNHNAEPSVQSCFSKKRGGYEAYATKSLHGPKQLFVSYGPHSNAKLLLEYGFALPANVSNRFSVSLEDVLRVLGEESAGRPAELPKLSPKHRAAAEKAALKTTLYESAYEPPWTLQALLHILTLPFDELGSWERVLGGSVRPWSPRVGVAMAYLLQTLLRELAEQLAEAEAHGPVPETVRQLWDDDLRVLEQTLQQTLHKLAKGDRSSSSEDSD